MPLRTRIWDGWSRANGHKNRVSFGYGNAAFESISLANQNSGYPNDSGATTSPRTRSDEIRGSCRSVERARRNRDRDAEA